MTLPPQMDPHEGYQPQWSQMARTIAMVFLIVSLIFLLSFLTPVASLLAYTLVIMLILFPICKYVARQTPLTFPVIVVIAYLLIVLLIVVLVMVIIPSVIDGLNNLITTLNTGLTQLQEFLAGYEPSMGIVDVFGVQADLNFILEPLRDFLVGAPLDVAETTQTTAPQIGQSEISQILSQTTNITSIVTTLSSALTSFVGDLTNLTTTLFLSLFVSFLILIDLPNTMRMVANNVPGAYHREVSLLLEKTEKIWTRFFRGEFVVGMIIGVLTFIQLTILGVPGALLLAVFTGFISLIPAIGGIIALVPLAIVPLVQGSTTLTDLSNVSVMIIVVLSNLLITQIIWNVVAPKILGDALNLPMPVMIVGVFVGAAVAGILGAFLIAPFISMLVIYFRYVIAKIEKADPYPNEEPEYFIADGVLGRGM